MIRGGWPRALRPLGSRIPEAVLPDGSWPPAVVPVEPLPPVVVPVEPLPPVVVVVGFTRVKCAVWIVLALPWESAKAPARTSMLTSPGCAKLPVKVKR